MTYTFIKCCEASHGVKYQIILSSNPGLALYKLCTLGKLLHLSEMHLAPFEKKGA